jgi:hypothetical protein
MLNSTPVIPRCTTEEVRNAADAIMASSQPIDLRLCKAPNWKVDHFLRSCSIFTAVASQNFGCCLGEYFTTHFAQVSQQSVTAMTWVGREDNAGNMANAKLSLTSWANGLDVFVVDVHSK